MTPGDTFYVRGEGGSIFEFTVPPEGTVAGELLAEKLANEALAVVAEARWVDAADGSRYLVEVTHDDDTPPPAIPAVSKDALLARAAELGVEVKGNWGAPKLTEAIAAAEQALADAAAAAAAQAADGGTPATGSDDGTQPTV